MTTVAAYLATFLHERGVSRVFGLPGGENVPVLEALRQTGIDFVLVHHESAAGFAADVTGQLTDQPGVCLATVGPGAVNLVATAAGATLERSPVLAITAVIDPTLRPHVTHMKADLHDMFLAACKRSILVTAETAVADFHAAWELAMAAPRGAVHLGISPEVALQTVSIQQPDPTPPAHIPWEQQKGYGNLKMWLETSARPFLIAGVGIEAAAAHDELLALVDAWQTPVAVTPKAKGHFPESHPLFAGCFTAYGDLPLRQALAECDLIIGAGLDAVDFVTSTWEINAPVVNFNLAGADDPVLHPLTALDGDLREILTMIRPYRYPDPTGPKRAATLRIAIAAALRTPYPDAPGRIKLHDLITALQEAAPEETAVTIDVGAFKLVFLQQWRTDRPKSVFVANGLSAMGYAIPGALAIKLAQPDRPVVAVAGDGALLMYAGEPATVARSGVPLVILVVVDEALSLIRLKQIRNEVSIHGTEFGQTDYQALARAFGLDYRLVDGRGTAVDIPHDALNLPHPVLVEARVNKNEYDHFK